MEQSKTFYENSTRQLVNILECLSSQLSVSNTCNTRHCNDNMDSDSFDSLLSRRSHDQSSQRPSIESYNHQPEISTAVDINHDQNPVYENVFYDNLDPANSVVPHQKLSNVAQPKCLKLSQEHNEIDSSKVHRRYDSHISVIANGAQIKALPPVPAETTSRPSLSKEGGTRNRYVS